MAYNSHPCRDIPCCKAQLLVSRNKPSSLWASVSRPLEHRRWVTKVAPQKPTDPIEWPRKSRRCHACACGQNCYVRVFIQDAYSAEHHLHGISSSILTGYRGSTIRKRNACSGPTQRDARYHYGVQADEQVTEAAQGIEDHGR